MEHKNNKIGVISYREDSAWISCNSILDNITTSYLLTALDIEKLYLSQSANREQLSNLAQIIIENKYTYLVFADHRIIPNSLLLEISNLTADLPSIIIHVYGDFFLNRNLWANGNSLLQKFKIKFVCASSAQSLFLKNFLEESSKDRLVKTIPFPVSDKMIFSEEVRSEERTKLKISTETCVLAYSGRISLQKNVLDLITLFSWLQEFIPNIRLNIAGPFDDIGIPYIGLSRRPLTMEHEFFLLLEKLPTSIRGKISYFGNLDNDELLKFYHSADILMSFSTHNDEDFGMAPAEALCLGLPLILTNWGGFSDFKLHIPQMVHLLHVDLLENKLKPSKTLKQNTLKAILSIHQASNLERSKASLEAQEIYGTRAISKYFNSLFEDDFITFDGFNSLFFTSVAETKKLGPFQSESNGFSPLYTQLYSCHLNPGVE
jgi:glycosyltransferase involved in cell wall biosynthesis